MLKIVKFGELSVGDKFSWYEELRWVKVVPWVYEDGKVNINSWFVACFSDDDVAKIEEKGE